MGHRDNLPKPDHPAPGHRSGEGAATARVFLGKEANAAAAPVGSPARSKHIVLIVDDNEAMRYATARALRALGFPVIEAATGAEGLALASAASAVVLDVRLPDMDGFEVCRRLRLNAQGAKLPVVHFSALAGEDTHRALSKAVGADRFVAASMPPARLATLLDELIDRTLP
jgi:CheY-like chemotaxis protein